MHVLDLYLKTLLLSAELQSRLAISLEQSARLLHGSLYGSKALII